jgi:probable selenium-dependent hydroxylase accessory protein YqeC
VVGAGGKKTLMRRLAEAFPGKVCLTTTVRIPPMRGMADAVHVAAPRESLVEQARRAAARHRIVVCTDPDRHGSRFGGIDRDLPARLLGEAGFDLVVVKADGARMRLIKAPEGDEPLIADATSLVVPIVSVAAVGHALDDRVAHHAGTLAAIVGAVVGDVVGESHIARLLVSDSGSLKGTAGMRVVPMLNMADDETRLAMARRIANLTLDSTDRVDSVLAASLLPRRPDVHVVRGA